MNSMLSSSHKTLEETWGILSPGSQRLEISLRPCDQWRGNRRRVKVMNRRRAERGQGQRISMEFSVWARSGSEDRHNYNDPLLRIDPTVMVRMFASSAADNIGYLLWAMQNNVRGVCRPSPACFLQKRKLWTQNVQTVNFLDIQLTLIIAYEFRAGLWFGWRLNPSKAT